MRSLGEEKELQRKTRKVRMYQNARQQRIFGAWFKYHIRFPLRKFVEKKFLNILTPTGTRPDGKQKST